MCARFLTVALHIFLTLGSSSEKYLGKTLMRKPNNVLKLKDGLLKPTDNGIARGIQGLWIVGLQGLEDCALNRCVKGSTAVKQDSYNPAYFGFPLLLTLLNVSLHWPQTIYDRAQCSVTVKQTLLQIAKSI